MALLFRSTARCSATVCQKLAAPSVTTAVNSLSQQKLSTSSIVQEGEKLKDAYVDSGKDERLPSGDPSWRQKAVFDLNWKNQVGLYHDDMLNEQWLDTANCEVNEAVRRLPPDLQDERSFRIIRAMNLTANKQILPKDEWVTYEENQTKGRYLQPFIQLVRKEMKEKAAWQAKVDG